METRKVKYNKKPNLIKIKGHEVVFYEIKNDTVMINCYIKNGSIFETEKNVGISHFLEHLITNAWKKCNFKECSIYWGERGIYYNAHTHLTAVKYTIHGIKKYVMEMLEYITTIVNNPKLLLSNFENERAAVRTELLTYLNKKEYELNEGFNKNFFNIEGLELSHDYKLQLANLNKLTKKDLHEWYNKYYTKFLFTIIGNFNKKDIVDYLSKKLNKKKNILIPLRECFSYKNDIIYINQKTSKQTMIKIGFPSQIKSGDNDVIIIRTICSIMQRLLFIKLRTKLKLIYGIRVTPQLNECGNYIIIDVNVDNEKAEQVIKNIIKIIQYYTINNIDNTTIKASRNQFLYSYNNLNLNSNKEISQFFNSQYFNQFNNCEKEKIYSFNDLKNSINKLTSVNLKRLIKSLFNIEKCLIVYQSNKKLFREIA